MRRIRTLIVDDEPLAREGLAHLLGGDAEVEIVGACGDGVAAADEIREKRPDLVFLDIQMPALGGLEVLDALPRGDWPAIVFVTAYEKYAVRAFEFSAIDYLLKPFGDARFRAALGKAKARLRNTAAPERLCFKSGHDHLFVDPAEIGWIEAQGRGVRMGAAGQVHLVGETLQSVERRLHPGRFLRAHRSFLVNRDRIVRIKSALYGDQVALMTDGAKIPLSRSYWPGIRAALTGGASAPGDWQLVAPAVLPKRTQA